MARRHPATLSSWRTLALALVVATCFVSGGSARNREPCTSKGGSCVSQDGCAPPKTWAPSLCPDDPNGVRCCLPEETYEASPAQRDAAVERASSEDSGAAPVPRPAVRPSGGPSLEVALDTRCSNAGGRCMDQSGCAPPALTRAGLCPGPVEIKCCIDGAEAMPRAVAAINLTPFLNGYVTLGERSADAAVAKLVATATAFASEQRQKFERQPWRFERILSQNVARAVPKVAEWASERTREGFRKVREILSLPEADYYVTVEEPRLDHLDLKDMSVEQVRGGVDVKAKVSFQGRFDVAVRRETPPPRQEFLRFTALLHRPLSFEVTTRVRVPGSRESPGRATAEVDFAFGADTDAALNMRIEGSISIQQDRFSAIGAKFSEMRSKLLEVARGASRWHNITRDRDIRQVFGRLDAEVRDVASAVHSYVHTGDDLATKTFGEIVSSNRVREMRDMVVKAALPHINAAMAQALNSDGASAARQFLATPFSTSDPASKLHVTVRRVLLNSALLHSDFGLRIQDAIIRQFLVDVSGIALAKYKWLKKEREMGRPLSTLDACARAACLRGGTGSHMCADDNLLNHKAINSLMFRSPRLEALRGSERRRVCFEGKSIPAVLTPGTNLGSLPTYCCRVDVTGTSIGSPQVSSGSCSNNACTGFVFPDIITEIAISYGRRDASRLNDAEQHRAQNLKTRLRLSRLPPVLRPIAFRGSDRTDIADDRWWASRTVLYARREPPRGNSLIDIAFAWEDQGERCPDGYTRLSKTFSGKEDASLTRGVGTRSRGFKKLYACVLYGPVSARSITHIELIAGNKSPASPGFHVIRSTVGGKSANFNFGRWNDDREAVFVSIRRASAGGIPPLTEPFARVGERDIHWADAENARGRAIDGGAVSRSLRPVARPRRTDLFLLQLRARAQAKQATRSRALRTAERRGAEWVIMIEVPGNHVGVRLWMHTLEMTGIALHTFKVKYHDVLPAIRAGDGEEGGARNGLPGVIVDFEVSGGLTFHAILEGRGTLTRSIGTWGRRASEFSKRCTAERFPTLDDKNVMYNSMDATESDARGTGEVAEPEPASARAHFGGSLGVQYDPSSEKWEVHVRSMYMKDLQLDAKNENSAWIVRGTLGIAESAPGLIRKVLPWLSKRLEDMEFDLGESSGYGEAFLRLPNADGARMEVDMSFNVPERLFKDKVMDPVYEMMRAPMVSGGIGVAAPAA